jgi:L-asparaginase
MSDSATVAGTYCTAVLGCSATGTGEQIVDDALAARLETRCRDGLPLAEASQRCFAEARSRGRGYGWIALDRSGAWAICHTTPAMSFALVDASGPVALSWPHPG